MRRERCSRRPPSWRGGRPISLARWRPSSPRCGRPDRSLAIAGGAPYQERILPAPPPRSAQCPAAPCLEDPALHAARASIIALLVAVFGVLAGNGMMTTLVPVRGEL